MVICSFTLMSPIACKKDLMFSVPAYVSPQISSFFCLLDDLSQITFVLDDMSHKGAIEYKEEQRRWSLR